jgi:hypothetical protein
MLFTWKRTVRCNPAPLYKAYDKRRLAKAAMNLTPLFRSTWKSKNNDRQGRAAYQSTLYAIMLPRLGSAEKLVNLTTISRCARRGEATWRAIHFRRQRSLWKACCELRQSSVSALGRVKKKLVPTGRRGNAQSLPPCASMIERQMERPRPIPWDFVVKNGSKMRSM